jgi:outer membrane immunogenic protein
MELRMRKLIFAAGAAAIALTAAPAFAQDTGPAGPQPDRVFNGPRVGAILGYDWMQPGRGPNSDIGDTHDAGGLLYGGDIGYDYDTGHAVFGVEGEVTGSTGKTDNDPLAANELGYGRVRQGRDLYLGARAGIKVNPTTLIYAKGGYTNGRLDLTHFDGSDTYTGRHFNLDGYRIGAGVEEAIGPRTYAKIEYRYSNYGDARLEYPNGTNTGNFDVDTDRHQIVAGLGVRF